MNTFVKDETTREVLLWSISSERIPLCDLGRVHRSDIGSMNGKQAMAAATTTGVPFVSK